MRKVGEKGFSALGQAKKIPSKLRENSEQVVCTDCGWVGAKSYIVLKLYHGIGKFRCFNCNAKKKDNDKREVNKAIIALAKRKGLI